MASSDEAEMLAASGHRSSSVGHENAHGPRRGPSKHQEFHDELAQETKRVTLLDREEQQLKGRKHYARVVFIFGIADDRKAQIAVEQEFSSWRDRQESGSELTGILIFLGQVAVSFLEGPAEMIFKGVELFNDLSQDVQPAPAMPLPPSDMRANVPANKTETEASPAPRAALISPIRILYFSELHGVRVSTSWCAYASSAKPSTGNAGNVEDNCHELVFGVYKKLLVVCLKVTDVASNETNPDALQNQYRSKQDMMPSPDEVTLLLGKQGTEYLFSFPEFQKVFMKPFQLVLNSELMWPMPPALSY